MKLFLLGELKKMWLGGLKAERGGCKRCVKQIEGAS
jgi:hypothetical protein